MRIKSIQLSWFRGAADQIELDLNCKSMVIYRENGSGKSSFVDSVEYILNHGRINHLAHEYSGRNQEKAIHNTHKPNDCKTEICFKFEGDSELKSEIFPDGKSNRSGAGSKVMDTWDYRSTILRQDEVAAFIHNTKGEKFSVLLPLLGLDELVIAAENVKQTIKSVEATSKIKDDKYFISIAEKERKKVFGTDSDDDIIKKIKDLYQKYCSNNGENDNLFIQCNEINNAIETKSRYFSTEFERYRLLQNIGKLKLKEEIVSVRTANSKIAKTVEPLIIEKLRILESANQFAIRLNEEKNIICPACGSSITVNEFQSHVKSEQDKLKEIILFNENRQTAINTLCTNLNILKLDIQKNELKTWREELDKNNLSKNLYFIINLDTENLRDTCKEEELAMFEELLIPLVISADLGSKNAPPNTQDLLIDKDTADAGIKVFEALEKTLRIKQVEAITNYLAALEQDIRANIKTHTQVVINDISSDIQNMWKILHPTNTIKDIRLYFPPDEEKAIDINLEFHGIDQPSPRMTLSEGYRNSLGLSIFLSMAKRKSDTKAPILLDDVIVSLDRNHRGMVAELLKKEFSERQVIIFTHDRDWYTELRHQLDNKKWVFKTFLPYETPEIGIRWSHKSTTFDEARSYMTLHPDTAGNNARKIMDIELALIAEKLKIRFPYLRGEKNDRRMAHDFLLNIASNGKKSFQKKVNDKYEIYLYAINMLEDADSLIVTWGNRSSHSFDIVLSEAKELINACEKAIECFKCQSCKQNVWFLHSDNSKFLQCQCGELIWKFGKSNPDDLNHF